jgi:tetratricopeptide (TPR) repeat protein
MSRFRLWKVSLTHLLLVLYAFAQTTTKEAVSKKSDPAGDFSREALVIEQSLTRVAFNSDGTARREQKTHVRIQSEAGVQQYGVINAPYQNSVERAEVDYVRVRKTDGTIISTPADTIQDITSEVSRVAPFYSDLREKHVAVKGLAPGDTLEYAVHWEVEKPLAPGQFWFGYSFLTSSIILDEQLEIGFPREREVRVKSQTVQPSVTEENGRRLYHWRTSCLNPKSKDEKKDELSYETVRGLLPQPDVRVSSFRSWEEVGRWYGDLQQQKAQPSAEVKAKAAELTKSATDDVSKLTALYNYVSQRYRYIGIAFGIGRYQPHSSGEILDNQYGDCKDKHTLLAALASAVGMHVYPALISSSSALDQDLPSPGQFDHVISVAPLGNQTYWMDTTSEMAPLGLLVVPLREKPALVITPEKVGFQTTPSVPPFASHEEFEMSGKLGEDGTFDAQAKSLMRDDVELVLRLAFRSLPQSRWQELVQRVSSAGGFGGTVSDVQTSRIEKTDEPLSFTYRYNRKDYSDWENHRILAAIPFLTLPAVKDEDLSRTSPFWITAPGEWQYQSRIELPKGFSAQTPPPLKLKEDFAEFESSSEIHDGVLVTKRHLVVKAREVTPPQLKAYKAFQKTLSEDQLKYIQLYSSGDEVAKATTAPKSNDARAEELFRKALSELPNSANSEALQAENDGREAFSRGELSSAIGALKHATTIDPKFVRAWIELGVFYEGSEQQNAGVDAFHKALEADPSQIVTYKIFAFALADMRRRAEAIEVLEKLQKIAPDDRDLAPTLGLLYLDDKRYKDAIPVFEAATKASPYDAYMMLQLGRARLHAGQAEPGMAAMKKALEINSDPELLNDVAYEMAEAGTNYSEALGYSLESIRKLEDASRKIDIENVQPEDLRLPLAIGAYWDTLGWIYYKMGDLPMAEQYLNAAWQLRQDGIVGDHLGQVYEKQGKLSAALHTYSLALQASPKLEDTPRRMRALAAKHVTPAKSSVGGADELSQMRTFKLSKRIVSGNASADFYVPIGVGGKVEKSSFLRGSELLRFSGDELVKSPVKVVLPQESGARLLRRGILSCSSYTGCSFVFYPAAVAATGN